MTDIKKKLQDEISTLEYELHVELPKEILKARAHGDLSENAEYHAAKDRQGFVNARLNQLKKRLAEMSMIDFSKIPRDRAGLGSTLVVLDIKRDEEITYNLVTTEEADAANGKVIKDMLSWILKSGESEAPSLSYAPLPQALADKVLQTTYKLP